MRRALPALFAFFLLVAAGCGAAASAGPEALPAPVEPEPEPWVDVSPPAVVWPQYGIPIAQVGDGCTRALPEGIPAGRTTLRRMIVDGTPREYRVHRPADSANGRPLPLVLNFHGRGSNGETQERYSGLVPLSERDRFVLVSPDGTGAPKAWHAGATTGSTVDDVAFIRSLIDVLRQDLCIDPSQVFAAGFSNGAFMAAEAACALGERIAALAMVGGATPPSANCVGKPRVIAFHGTADQVVPFGGGTIRGVYAYPGARAAMDGWAARAGCTGTDVRRQNKHVVWEERTGCTTAVRLAVIEGDGHTWPGASEVPAFGTTTREIMASEAIWTFFAGKR
ncbi:MAG: alpha/beta hydrolase family esterase [Dehalococcoidia bacterium]